MEMCSGLSFGSMLPSIPAIADFKIREGSSMSFLKNVFEAAGLNVSVSRNHLQISAPTEAQEQSLTAQGVSAGGGKTIFYCSPRTMARGF